MVWTPGQPLQNGKYIIDRVLGVGGFGITYLATQHSPRQNRKPVVIKTLKDEIRHDPKFANYQTKLQQDFLNEALKLAKCLHPHIVEVQEIIREGNLDCIVMEFVQGESLADRLSRQGVLTETEALRYIQQAGDALTVVHNRGLLHRDIKPQNIMIRSDTSEAVLIDFGLAREFMQDLIQTHSLALTHGFAPPEQYDRQARRGAYTDVYALAATLYCSLTKHTPHPAYLRLSGRALESPKQLNPGISDRVNKAILKGLELKPENRPQSMQEWLSLLEEPIVQPVVSVGPATVQPQPVKARSNSQALSNFGKYSQTPSRKAAKVSTQPNQNPPVRSPSRIIPWRSLAGGLAGYVTVGALLTVFSAPFWTVALFWAVAAVEGATLFDATEGRIRPFLWSVLQGVPLAMLSTLIKDWNGAWILALFSIGTIINTFWSLVRLWAGLDLLESFSRSHTFLILSGTSLAGLSLGWLIGTMLR